MIRIEKMIDSNRYNVVNAINTTKDLIDTFNAEVEIPELDILVIELNNLIIDYDNLVEDFHHIIEDM